ncbi:hypothetical protein BCR44DRAFT_1006362 [Catenaria anguillulae PL171]|uniref:Secreted protein n=1 Tax=Catenaria anguillulae PL171 TaxID=765915 RepID=A0A1Y2I3J5_9FUNG|nr:hypothetical protein BCR44DRAFT_1006362 [Catenaria anguillulae PL171]
MSLASRTHRPRFQLACLVVAAFVACLALSRPASAAQIRLALSLPLSAADDGPRARRSRNTCDSQ